nr:uncharacterized protein LOC119166690 [Rhipicephalus microplus]
MHRCAACLSCLRLIEEPTWIHVASAVLQSLYKEHRLSFAIILAAGAATRTENLPTFILQIFGVLLLAQAGGEEPALLSGYDGAPLPSHQAHHVRIVHLESTLGDLPGNRPASVTSCADADRHNVKTALLADWSGIKTGHPSTQAIGHGSTARMQHLNPFVYLPQVSRRYEKCIRSNYLCLIVLPCPRQICVLWSYLCTCIKKLQLLSGDIETNPGPDMNKIMKQLQVIADEIKEERLKSIEAKLEQVTLLENKITSCVSQVTNLQKTVQYLELKIDDLENRSRRSNLLVYGVPEEADEHPKTLEQTISEQILKNILKIKPVPIDRMHRIGKQNAQKPRPVMLKLFDFQDKVTILRNCTKLKSPTFSVGEDFSNRVRYIRKMLWQIAKTKKEAGDKVFLVYDKLKVNEDLYRWDDDTNDIVLVSADRHTINHDKTTKRKHQASHNAAANERNNISYHKHPQHASKISTA